MLIIIKKINHIFMTVFVLATAAVTLFGMKAYALQWDYTNVAYGPEARQWMNIAVPVAAEPSGIFFGPMPLAAVLTA